MTYREKLEQEHPELIDPCFLGGCAYCPSAFGYEPHGNELCDLDQNGITDKTCRKCWDREIEQ